MKTSEVWFSKHLGEYSVMRVKSHSFGGKTIVLKSTKVVLKNSLKKLQTTA